MCNAYYMPGTVISVLHIYFQLILLQYEEMTLFLSLSLTRSHTHTHTHTGSLEKKPEFGVVSNLYLVSMWLIQNQAGTQPVNFSPLFSLPFFPLATLLPS